MEDKSKPVPDYHSPNVKESVTIASAMCSSGSSASACSSGSSAGGPCNDGSNHSW